MDKKVEEWIEIKKEIQEKTKRCERLRHKIEEYMTEKQTNELKTDLYVVKKGDRTRDTISKDSLPKAVWDKYKRQITFSSITVRRRK